ELDQALAASDTRNARRLPFRGDIPELLLAADIACLVSEFEGLPVFLLEALQLGRPFVATDVGDIARVVRPSGAGRVAGPPGDLDALASALRELLDPAARHAAGAAAAAAAANFGVASCAARYGTVFRSAIASRHDSGAGAAAT
ncbi:MAG: glycosyltransferase, partial [Thermoanaerobaculia bacterium]